MTPEEIAHVLTNCRATGCTCTPVLLLRVLRDSRQIEATHQKHCSRTKRFAVTKPRVVTP